MRTPYTLPPGIACALATAGINAMVRVTATVIERNKKAPIFAQCR
jgi:hypothetical protein